MSILARQMAYTSSTAAPQVVDVEEQHEHAVSPSDFTVDVTVTNIVLTIGVFFAVIYLMQLLERKLS